MKKTCLIGIMAVIALMAVNVNADLVQHWPLDGNALNAVTGGVDGTAVGGLTYTTGIIDGAAVFNGTDAAIKLASELLPVSQTISISYWVNLKSLGWYYDSILSTDGYNSDSIHNTLTSDGRVVFATTLNQSAATVSALNFNEWTMITWTLDSTAPNLIVCKFYVNGVLDATRTLSSDKGFPVQAGTIGCWWTGTAYDNRWLDGMVDDFRIYNEVLSDAAVFQLFVDSLKIAWGPSPENGTPDVNVGTELSWNEPGAFVSSPTYNVYFGTTTPPALVSSNQAATTYVPSLNYDTQYYWRVDTNDPNGMVTHTGEEWAFKTYQAYNPHPSDLNTNASTEPLLRWSGADFVDTYEVWFGTTSPSTSLGTTTLTDSSELTLPTLSPNTTYKWRVNSNIGAQNLTGPVWTFTTGQLVGKWLLDGDATDTSGFGNHGTITGATSVPTEKAYLFDGSSYVDVPAALYTPVDTAISVALWSNGDTSLPDGENNVFSAVTGTYGMVARCHFPYYGYIIYDSSNGIGWPCNRVEKYMDSVSMVKEQWNHWVFTSDTDSGDMKIYFNGELWATQTGQTRPILADEVWQVYIGAYADTGTNGYKGMLKDVRVYNMEVGANLAAAIYAQGPYAINPDPTVGEVNVSPDAVLSWTAGAGAVSHDVYFGADAAAVLAATTASPEYMGNQAGASYDPAGTLTPDTTYYWRVDEVDAGANVWKSGVVWSFTTIPPTATMPDPEDGETGVDPLAVTLSWTAGIGADSHNVYFGTDSGALVLQVNQTGTTFNPGVLAYNTTYYWRIDEVSNGDTYTGGTWSFTTIVPTCTSIPVGDINGDCIVDLTDFAELAANWLKCNLTPVTACP